jgi:hypothetical protein
VLLGILDSIDITNLPAIFGQNLISTAKVDYFRPTTLLANLK